MNNIDDTKKYSLLSLQESIGTVKILFITYLAIGDFVYLQNYFVFLKELYPSLRIDLWVDELRRSWKFWRWRHLAKYSLHDWIRQVPYFTALHLETYSPFALWRMCKRAQQENYSIIIALTTFRSARLVKLAKRIAPNADIISIGKSVYGSRSVAERVLLDGWHINDCYAGFFEDIFGVCIPQEKRVPFIEIPSLYYDGAQSFLKDMNRSFIFINSFAKTHKREWSINKVLECIRALRLFSMFADTIFIVNTLPENYNFVDACVRASGLRDVRVFTAKNNFFELPAIISYCTAVISVETAVMHLASALKIPVLALMRHKNPEWRPYDNGLARVVYASGRGFVQTIPVKEVVRTFCEFYRTQQKGFLLRV